MRKGYFSNAVKVHNYTWEQEGGSTGRTERLLTEQGEGEYVKEMFKK
ncbi:DUF6241 domain-containing protein [Sporosarcina koreensis]|nr:DUF6241 domain-containing protein [Sporosarcina koreensis]